jgi:hypothetical protein
VSYQDALLVALCYGWIDGQKRPFDATHWLQRFTPRSPRSRWSKRNTDLAEQLIARGAMQPGGAARGRVGEARRPVGGRPRRASAPRRRGMGSGAVDDARVCRAPAGSGAARPLAAEGATVRPARHLGRARRRSRRS